MKIEEIKKEYSALFRAIKFLGECYNRKLKKDYIFTGVDKQKFRVANDFIKSIGRSSVRSICKKYNLPKSLPSLEDNPDAPAFEEFIDGEQLFAEALEKRLVGAKYASRIIKECFEGKWDNAYIY